MRTFNEVLPQRPKTGQVKGNSEGGEGATIWTTTTCMCVCVSSGLRYFVEVDEKFFFYMKFFGILEYVCSIVTTWLLV